MSQSKKISYCDLSEISNVEGTASPAETPWDTHVEIVRSADHATGLSCIACNKMLVDIFSRVILWGDAISSGKAQNTSTYAPWLFNSLVRLLARCGDDVLELVTVLSQVLSGIIPNMNDATSLKIWLEKANSIADAEFKTSDNPATRLEDAYDKDSLLMRIARILASCDDNVELLMNMLPSIEHIGGSEEHNPSDKPDPEVLLKVSKPAWKWIDQVASKYDGAAQSIIERLGEANWQRFCRLRISADSSHASELCQAETIFHAPMTAQVTELLATSMGRTKSFIDSAYGTSINTCSDDNASIALHSSFASTTAKDTHHSNRVPPKPAEASAGEPFTCGICNQWVSDIRNRIDWKMHVFRDLMPYICLQDTCTAHLTFFTTRKSWAEHDVTHRQQTMYRCRNCDLHDMSRQSFDVHIVQNHANLNTNQRAAFMNAAKYSRPPNHWEWICPLCQTTGFGSARKCTSHVCRHMEDIALSTLPSSIYADEPEEDTTEDDSVSDQLFGAAEPKLNSTSLEQPRPRTSSEPCDIVPASSNTSVFLSAHDSPERSREFNGQASAIPNMFQTGPKPFPSNVDEEDYIIKCICDYGDDDGNTVFCEKCDIWQHIECCYHQKSVPEIHLCIDYAPKETPRDLNPEEAKKRQRRARDLLDRDRDRRVENPAPKKHKKKISYFFSEEDIHNLRNVGSGFT